MVMMVMMVMMSDVGGDSDDGDDEGGAEVGLGLTPQFHLSKPTTNVQRGAPLSLLD